jgi:TPP-dependent trihydroxycyclohexane-1,2-dione (THcHDO) dehydratase
MTYDDDVIPEGEEKEISPFDFAERFAEEFGANLIFFSTFQELSDQIERAEQRKAAAILNHDSGSLLAAESDFKILIDAFQKGAETLEDGA